MIQLYSKKDEVLLNNKIDDMINNVNKKKMEIFVPAKEELDKIHNVIFNFIRTNKRKIYGGYAQNKVIMDKNPKDGFYDEDHLPDIDFYSPDPIVDIIKICNILFENGHKNIEGKEAQHKETYTIFVEYVSVCDISYVPLNIFHRMPFIEIDGIHYIHPSFVMIDMYREYTDPYHSIHRWAAKTFSRVITLQKYFPFKKVSGKLNIQKIDNNMKLILNTVYNFLINNESIIVIGHYAYNYLLNESGILKDNILGEKYTIYEIPYYELISTDYKNDGLQLIEMLKEYNLEFKEDINIIEHYPLWNYLGYNVYIKYKEIIICRLIHYNDRCIPIKKVIPKKIIDDKLIKHAGKKDDFIQLGSYTYILLNNLIFEFQERINKNNDGEKFYRKITYHLVEMRNYYLKRNNKTLLDDTLFQEFLITCIGKSAEPKRDNFLRNKKRRELKKIQFRYKPEEKVFEPRTQYKFPNCSGNPIKYINNLKLNISTSGEQNKVNEK
jgi:hypothetical protein